jgi:hypothetical protein
LQPPQKYQPLRDDHARVAKESAPKAEKQEAPSPAPDAEQEPEPHRPERVHPLTGRVTDSGGMQPQHALMNDLMEQHRAIAASGQNSQAETAEKIKGKDVPVADLAEAKEQKPRTMEEFLEREREQRDVAKEKVAQSIGGSEAMPEQETQQECSRDGGQSL